MAANPSADMAEVPVIPDRAVRASEDNRRASEETGSKRPVRASYDSNARTIVPTQPMLDRVAHDRGHQLSPSQQQLAQWQPPPRAPSVQPTAVEHFEQPTMYTRSTTGDYTVYDGGAPAPPTNHYSSPPYPGSEIYFQPVYQGMRNPDGPARTSGMVGRQTSLANRPTQRTTPAGIKPHWDDGYEPTVDDYEEEATPRKKSQPRRRTNIYLVREGSGGADGGSPPPDEVMRLPFTGFMHGSLKNHFVAFLGEFVGTTMFLFFAFAGTIVANVGAQESSDNTTTNATVGFSPIVNLYVAVSFGFALMVNVWIFFRVSGGLFNPAVTLGMVMTKSINYIRGFLLVAAQIGGAIFASFLVGVLFPLDFNVRTTLSKDTSLARGVFIEAILTAELVFTVFMLAKEKHKATYMAPIGIGLALFVAELVGVFFTGGSLNPARSLGPCVTTGQFGSDHWVYWVGPAIGSVAAVVFYRFIKILEYEMANPGQDDTGEEEEAANQESKERREDV